MFACGSWGNPRFPRESLTLFSVDIEDIHWLVARQVGWPHWPLYVPSAAVMMLMGVWFLGQGFSV